MEVATIRATNGAAGVLEATTTDGRAATVTFSLAPRCPPRIQDYEVKLTPPGDGDA
jgi:hypothetical protein